VLPESSKLVYNDRILNVLLAVHLSTTCKWRTWSTIVLCSSM